jgi:hypothetical protein
VRSPAHRSLLAARAAGGLAPAQADVLLAPRPVEELCFTPEDPSQLRNLAADPARGEVLARMRAVLDKMMELESFNEVLELLRGMIRTQEQIRTETLEQQKRRAREALERP